MERNWVEFNDVPCLVDRNAFYVSMNKRGDIVMNGYTFDAIDRPKAVIMLFDPDTSTIGVRPVSGLAPNAFPVRPRHNGSHQQIPARTFAVKHEIQIDGTVRFRTAKVENGILVLELRQMAKATRKPYKKAG